MLRKLILSVCPIQCSCNWKSESRELKCGFTRGLLGLGMNSLVKSMNVVIDKYGLSLFLVSLLFEVKWTEEAQWCKHVLCVTFISSIIKGHIIIIKQL